MKYGDVTLGQVEVIINKIGGLENLQAILRGEMTIELKELKENIQKLFDRNGRRIPPRDLKGSVCDPNPNFKLIQPEIEYSDRLKRLLNSFPEGLNFPSLEKFQSQSETLLKQLRQDKLLFNLPNGVWLPVCFPQFQVTDYGQNLEDVFLKAVENSYKSQFPGREFHNYQRGRLAGRVSIISGSRHEQLLVKMAEAPVVGIQFFPLQGFSILAQKEQISTLPESLILSGAMDIATAITAYPDVLARGNTPGYDCVANSWRSADGLLCFGAGDGELWFSGCGFFGLARGSYSGGLLFLG